MARTQECPASKPKYLDYFGLTEQPFTRLGDPARIFPAEQYGLLMSHLASATAETDCLVVLQGNDGSGKTTLLNAYLSELGDETFFATIDNNCRTATEFYGAFLTQLGFKDITGTLKELRRITERFLQHQASRGNTVLLVIDNVQTVRAVVLEQLRHIAEVSYRGRRALSAVIAGNSDLTRVLESPAMSELNFRSQVDFHIRMFDERETAEYVCHRLAQAGVGNVHFDAGALDLVHRFTGGCPAPVNELCHALLMAACNEDSPSISEHMVRAVASNLDLPPHVLPPHRRRRRSSDNEQISPRATTPRRARDNQPLEKDYTIAELREALRELRAALQQSESDRKAMVAELKKEQRALNRALAEVNRSKAEYAKLEDTCNALQASIDGLES